MTNRVTNEKENQSRERQAEKTQIKINRQTHSYIYKESQVQSDYTDEKEADKQSDKLA
jgi:hypothetical protein